MSNKVAHYLQQHLMGEVTTSADALTYFSTDASIFTKRPKIVIYPRNTADVRKTARFTWQLAEKGHVLPITARGKGTDFGGAALGEGIIMAFPAHMNKILELDRTTVTVQPGALFSKIEQTLHTHGRFLPPYPASSEYCTIGGCVANNASGEKSIKYGAMDKYVDSLHVVLANGELIKTGRISKREVEKRKGHDTFEGSIYRQIDTLFNDNATLIAESKKKTSKNTAGYAVWDVMHKDGSIDLTPLFIGGQGTLGIITQVTLKTEVHNPNTTLLVAYFDDIAAAETAIGLIAPLKPSALEMVDQHLLNFVHENHPEQLRGIVGEPYPKIVLLTEFDDSNDRTQKRKVKRARKILQTHAYEYRLTKDEHEKETLWKIRHSAAAVLWQSKGGAKALPIIEDGIVPRDQFGKLLEGTYAMLDEFGLDSSIWGHAGDANVHLQPFLDLGKIGDRQKIFKLIDRYYRLVLDLGGSTSGEHNDGVLRAPYLPIVYGHEMYKLFEAIKEAFDPYGTLNPGVKVGVNLKDLPKYLRKEYSLHQLFDHMPRT